MIETNNNKSKKEKKVSAYMTRDYLNDRAKRFSREKFEEALSHIPDVEPDEEDRL